MHTLLSIIALFVLVGISVIGSCYLFWDWQLERRATRARFRPRARGSLRHLHRGHHERAYQRDGRRCAGRGL